MSSIKDIRQAMLKGVTKEIGTSADKKKERKATTAVVISKLQAMGDVDLKAIIADQEEERQLWIKSNPLLPQDDTTPSWADMSKRHKARRNLHNETWGLPLEQ